MVNLFLDNDKDDVGQCQGEAFKPKNTVNVKDGGSSVLLLACFTASGVSTAESGSSKKETRLPLNYST